MLKQLAVCSQISYAISVDIRAVFNRTFAVKKIPVECYWEHSVKTELNVLLSEL